MKPCLMLLFAATLLLIPSTGFSQDGTPAKLKSALADLEARRKLLEEDYKNKLSDLDRRFGLKSGDLEIKVRSLEGQIDPGVEP